MFDVNDIKSFRWQELDGKTLVIQSTYIEDEYTTVVIGTDVATGKRYVIHIETDERKLRERIQQKCTHTYPNGFSSIQYCDQYEKRSWDMECFLCGKHGSREEFEKEYRLNNNEVTKYNI